MWWENTLDGLDCKGLGLRWQGFVDVLVELCRASEPQKHELALHATKQL